MLSTSIHPKYTKGTSSRLLKVAQMSFIDNLVVPTKPGWIYSSVAPVKKYRLRDSSTALGIWNAWPAHLLYILIQTLTPMTFNERTFHWWRGKDAS